MKTNQLFTILNHPIPLVDLPLCFALFFLYLMCSIIVTQFLLLDQPCPNNTTKLSSSRVLRTHIQRHSSPSHAVCGTITSKLRLRSFFSLLQVVHFSSQSVGNSRHNLERKPRSPPLSVELTPL